MRGKVVAGTALTVMFLLTWALRSSSAPVTQTRQTVRNDKNAYLLNTLLENKIVQELLSIAFYQKERVKLPGECMPLLESNKMSFITGTLASLFLACVASVSVRLRSKKRGTKVKDRATNGSRFICRAVKTENPLPRCFFAPKPNGDACYAG